MLSVRVGGWGGVLASGSAVMDEGGALDGCAHRSLRESLRDWNSWGAGAGSFSILQLTHPLAATSFW